MRHAARLRLSPLALVVAASAWILPATGLGAPAGEATGKSLLGEAKGISFSGYERDGAGRRQWSLDAATAQPADAAGKRWTIRAIQLKTYDPAGLTRLTVNAPQALFDNATHRAADPGVVALESTRVSLTGKDWAWTNLDARDTIEIKTGVRVTLRPASGKGERSAPALITASSLRAETGPDGLTLTFTGEVRVIQSGATLRADTLVTLVHTGGGKLGVAASGDGLGANAVERMTATGDVRITHKGAVITGDEALVTPATGAYTIRGHAEFRDLGDRRILVAGESMTYDLPARRITVAPDEDGLVHAELPPLDAGKNATAAPDAHADAFAERLTVTLAPAGMILAMDGGVALDDPDNRLRCDHLEVETPHTDSDFAAAKPATAKLRRALADGAVEMTRDGRTLRCGRAEIFPLRHTAILTGAPRGEDPAAGATLEADRMVLDTAAHTLRAEAGTAHPVRVTLPPLNKTTPTPVAVEAGLLLASRRGARGALFEFEDRVTLAGDALDGACDRLGIEVEAKSPSEPRGRVRRIVAAGHVKLTQAAYTAEAGRAEILPGALLKELSVKEDNGLDGNAPFFVTLESAPDTPDVRTRVTLPHVATPHLTAGDTPLALAPRTSGTDAATHPLTVDADFQELVAGRERVRAFARGGVSLTSADLNGTCASLEARALAPSTPPGAHPKFAADALVARGAVAFKLGERAVRADTFELFPAERRLALTGHPHVDGWPGAPGIARKTATWSAPSATSTAKSPTALHLADEASPGMPEQILRPHLTLPLDTDIDLGRALRKNLDKPSR